MTATETAINDLYQDQEEHAQIKAEREILVGRIKDQILARINPELATVLENIIKIFAQTRKKLRFYYKDSGLHVLRIDTKIDPTENDPNELVLKILDYPFVALADIISGQDPGPPSNSITINLSSNSFSIIDSGDITIESNPETLERLLRDFEHRLILATKLTREMPPAQSP